MTKPIIAIIGGRKIGKAKQKLAYEVGRLVAKHGGILLCGGLTGAMEAASKGAKEAGGEVIGLLPGEHKYEANRYVTIPLATGIGFARNALIAKAADVLIAIGGEYGTLSEIALALAWRKKVIGLQSWKIPGMIFAKTPEEAAKKAFL